MVTMILWGHHVPVSALQSNPIKGLCTIPMLGHDHQSWDSTQSTASTSTMYQSANFVDCLYAAAIQIQINHSFLEDSQVFTRAVKLLVLHFCSKKKFIWTQIGLGMKNSDDGREMVISCMPTCKNNGIYTGSRRC